MNYLGPFQEGFSNTILPLNVSVNTGAGTGVGIPSGNLAAGTVQVIFVEVLFSKLIRMALRMENKTLGRLILIHTLAMPLTGGLTGFVDPQVELRAAPTVAQSAMDGAKGVPAIFMAQYITNTALQGLHMPKISMSDILITAAAKILTRPALKFVYQYMPQAVQQNFDANDDMVSNQNEISRLKMK